MSPASQGPRSFQERNTHTDVPGAGQASLGKFQTLYPALLFLTDVAVTFGFVKPKSLLPS